MYRELIRVVERFKRPRLAVVGDLMLDRYVFGDAERISPEAPIQILRASSEETRLGGAGPSSTTSWPWGPTSPSSASWGPTPPATRCLRGLRRAGARTAGIVRVKGRPTTIKTRFVGRAQHRHPQQVLRVDWEDSAPLDGKVEKKLLAAPRAFLRTADTVVISDYNKGVLTPRLDAADHPPRPQRGGCPSSSIPSRTATTASTAAPRSSRPTGWRPRWPPACAWPGPRPSARPPGGCWTTSPWRPSS